MTQHTPEPWGVFQDASGDVFVSSKETSFHVAEVGSEDDETVIPDASRIVACVNAMAGIADDNAVFAHGNSVRQVISNMAMKQADAEKRAADLQAQVDELLDLLQSLENDAGQIPQFMWTKIKYVVKKHTGEPK